jgi:dihydroorotate dehydrogenase (fumarate)
VILHSLFEEQLIRERDTLDYFLAYGTESFLEAPTFFPNLSNYNFGPQGYLEHIRKIKEAVKIPVIASLNGFSPGGWIEIAQQIEQAGADAIELNMYYIAADYEQDSLQVEETYRHLLREIKASVKIPIAVKLGHHFTAFANFARQLDQEGVRGLVLFNRFYQPDIDLENLNIVPDLELSTPYELRLRLR